MSDELIKALVTASAFVAGAVALRVIQQDMLERFLNAPAYDDIPDVSKSPALDAATDGEISQLAMDLVIRIGHDLQTCVFCESKMTTQDPKGYLPIERDGVTAMYMRCVDTCSDCHKQQEWFPHRAQWTAIVTATTYDQGGMAWDALRMEAERQAEGS